MHEFWDYRSRCAADSFDRLFWKAMVTWTLGKFAERSEREVTIQTDDGAKTGWSDLDAAAGWYSYTVWSMPKLPNTAASAWILADARVRQYAGLTSCDVGYGDTDSVMSDERPVVPYGKNCGEWKLQKAKTASFLAPKTYRFGDNVRAKGFGGAGGFAKHLTRDGLELLAAGGAIETVNLTKIRTAIVRGDTVVLLNRSAKKLHIGRIQTKRCHLGNGRTRAWSVEE